MNQSMPPGIHIRNNSGETIPAFSICRLTTLYSVDSDGRPIMNVDKPDADILTANFVVTFGNEIANGGFSFATRLIDAVAIAIDQSKPDYIPDVGDMVGPSPNSFKARRGWGSLLVVSEIASTGVCSVLGLPPGLRVQVKMKEDLLAAVDTDTDPSYAWAYLRRKNADGDLQVTDQEIRICNRFEEISVDADRYAKAELIDGEIQLYAADCPGQGDSVSESLLEL